MQEFFGRSVSQGIALGEVYVLPGVAEKVTQEKIGESQIKGELLRFRRAWRISIEQQQQLYEETREALGEERAQIFEAYRLMLLDEDFVDGVTTYIESGHWNAEYAVWCAGERAAALLEGMETEYMRQRTQDVLDVSRKLVRVLLNVKERLLDAGRPVIVLAEEVSPGDMIHMNRDKVLALVTRQGSLYSHTAILARGLGIPMLTDINFSLTEDYGGRVAVVDGAMGRFILDPDAKTLKEISTKRKALEKHREALRPLADLESVTKDGRKIQISANLDSLRELGQVVASGADGIGLFRSEFLYLEHYIYPEEETQFEIYREVISQMGGRMVTIRTFDIGDDKQFSQEKNPALGYRGIRASLDNIPVFKAQLRAVYRAAAYGKAGILLPMIISCAEVRRAKEVMGQVKKELGEAGISFGEVALGIMIETPAAVMISDRLAAEADFFSIGTNDLIQCTLAIDRQNHRLDSVYNSHHEAIMRMIRMTVQNAHKAGIPVGICGELAGDHGLTEYFIDAGISELSVTPTGVLELRKRVRAI